MELRKFIATFNTVDVYLFLSICVLCLLAIYFYIIDPAPF